MRWNFTRGWPCKYTGPGLNAKNNEIGDGDARDLPRRPGDRRAGVMQQHATLPGVALRGPCRPRRSARRCAPTSPVHRPASPARAGGRAGAGRGLARVPGACSAVSSQASDLPLRGARLLRERRRGRLRRAGPAASRTRRRMARGQSARVDPPTASVARSAPAAGRFAGFDRSTCVATSPGTWGNGLRVDFTYRAHRPRRRARGRHRRPVPGRDPGVSHGHCPRTG